MEDVLSTQGSASSVPHPKDTNRIRSSLFLLQLTHNFLLPSENAPFFLKVPSPPCLSASSRNGFNSPLSSIIAGGGHRIPDYSFFLPHRAANCDITALFPSYPQLNAVWALEPQRWHLNLNLPFLFKIKDESVWAHALKVQSLITEKGWW